MYILRKNSDGQDRTDRTIEKVHGSEWALRAIILVIKYKMLLLPTKWRPEQLTELGLDEILEGEGVAAVEWADRFCETLPADHLRLTLEFEGPESRGLTVEATGPRATAWWEAARVD